MVDPTCERARLRRSELLDGVPDRVGEAERRLLDEHERSCLRCQRFGQAARTVRRRLRLDPIDRTPDIAAQVLTRLDEPDHDRVRQSRSRSRVLAVAAVFAVGLLLGALLVVDDGTDPGPVAAASIPDRVTGAQAGLDGLTLTFDLVERGWHREVPERRWDGSLRWEAPERLVLAMTDRTRYPTDDWVPDDVGLVVDGDTRTAHAPRDCPAEAQPTCTPDNPLIERVTGREPFAEDHPVPLDLVLPFETFDGAAEPDPVRSRRIAGRDTLGIRTTAAQAAPLLDSLRPGGNLREVHPADTVSVWLDEETMVPMGLEVRVVDEPGRPGWASRLGYEDEVGELVLELTVTSLELDADLGEPRADPDPPLAGGTSDEVVVDAGFESGPADERLVGVSVPDGFTPHRSGLVRGKGPAVAVASWSDGRAWLKARLTTEWEGDGVFGGVDSARAVATADGVVYVDESTGRVAVHTADFDAVVMGTAGIEALVAAAASLGPGEAVPEAWAVADATTLDEAAAAVPGLLAPTATDGFVVPAVQVAGHTVSLRYGGPGAKAFTVVEEPGDHLAPPLDQSVVAIDVGGNSGRWSAERGELEWVEDGMVVVVQSDTLGFGELLAVARSMEKP